MRSELLLKEEMGVTKQRLANKDLFIERFRGFVLVEGKEEVEDYELICSFNEITLRPLKNKESRLSKE